MNATAAPHHDWTAREELAERMIPLIGNLYRTRNVVTSIYGHRLINLSAIDIIKAHRFARRINDVELSLEPNANYTHSVQYFERTLDDSANRRLAIPESFLATDAILVLYHNVAAGLEVHPARIRRRLDPTASGHRARPAEVLFASPLTYELRDEIITALRDGHLTTTGALDRTPGASGIACVSLSNSSSLDKTCSSSLRSESGAGMRPRSGWSAMYVLSTP